MADEFPTDEIAAAFDELIEAHVLLRATERALEKYMADNVPPEVPKVFENVEALLRYNAQRERYEREISTRMERREDHVAGYERAASRVEHLLPEGARLIHAHGGSSADIPQGKRYAVYKESELTVLSPPEGVALETAKGEVSAVSHIVRVEEMGTDPR
jgi:hypothetical protein